MRWFLCFSFFFITYFSLNYFYGCSGIRAYQELELYRESLCQSVASLQQNQALLEEELASLYYSEEDLKLQVRKLGYFQKGENVVCFSLPSEQIKLSNQKPTPTFLKPNNLFSHSFFIISSFISGLIVSMLYSVIEDFIGSIRKRYGLDKSWKACLKNFIKSLQTLNKK